jgi:hypothetical protein
MLENLKRYSGFKKLLSREERLSIVDVLVFGSAVKGKERPRDVDLAVIFLKDADAEIIKKIEGYFEKGKLSVHISTLNVQDFFQKPHSLAKTLLHEGISLFSFQPLFHNFGFSSQVLYVYDLRKMTPSEKVRFVYAFKGRDGKGIVKRFGGAFIADGCFLIPIEKDGEILEIFEQWHASFVRRLILAH